MTEMGREYYQANREDKLEYSRRPDVNKRRLARIKERYATDEEYREHQKERDRKRRHTARFKETNSRRAKKLWAESPEHRIKSNLHKSLRRALFGTGKKKSERLKTLIGCEPAELVKHLESLWREGMTWDNYGLGKDKWHIDHIRPVSSFDLTTVEQQKACYHYTNLQPLWGHLNMFKKAKMPHEIGPELLPKGYMPPPAPGATS